MQNQNGNQNGGNYQPQNGGNYQRVQGNYQPQNGQPMQNQGQPSQQNYQPQNQGQNGQPQQQPQENGNYQPQQQPAQNQGQPQGQNYQQPQQQPQMPPMDLPSMVPPTEGNDSNKLDVPELQGGQYPVILLQIIDLGTQESPNYPAQRKVRLTFEFPTDKHQRYEDNPERTPTLVSGTYTYSLNEKANLRKLIASLLGKHVKDQSLDSFNIASLLGQQFFLTVAPNAKGYPEIQFGSPINPSFIQNIDMTRTNDLLIFFIDYHGFNSPVYGEIPSFVKQGKYNAIENSVEAEKHKANGGTFYQKPKNDNNNSNNNNTAASNIERANYGNQTVNQNQGSMQPQQPSYQQPQHQPSQTMTPNNQGQPAQQPQQQPQGNGNYQPQQPQQTQGNYQPQQTQPQGNGNYNPANNGEEEDDLPF